MAVPSIYSVRVDSAKLTASRSSSDNNDLHNPTRGSRQLPDPPIPRFGEPRATSSATGPPPRQETPSTEEPGSRPLGSSFAHLGRLAHAGPHRQARHRRSMAPSRLSGLLEMEKQNEEARKTKAHCRATEAHSADGQRQSALGSPAYSR